MFAKHAGIESALKTKESQKFSKAKEAHTRFGVVKSEREMRSFSVAPLSNTTRAKTYGFCTASLFPFVAIDFNVLFVIKEKLN